MLIVDDDPLMHLLYMPHLERAGYQPISANDGGQVLFLAAQESPAVIVMDVMMTNMDGLAALREIRQFDATKHIPVIVITSNVAILSIVRHEAQASGASTLLPKPFSPAQLVEEVRKLAPLPSKKP